MRVSLRLFAAWTVLIAFESAACNPSYWEHALDGLWTHNGRVMGWRPQVDLDPGTKVVHSVEASAEVMARDGSTLTRPVPTRSESFAATIATRDPDKLPTGGYQNGDGNWRGMDKPTYERFQDAYASSARDLKRLHSGDGNWKEMREQTQRMLAGDPADPVTQSVYQSLLGKHVAGRNIHNGGAMRDAWKGDTINVFEGRVKKVFAVTEPGKQDHRVMAEIVGADGRVSTVQLSQGTLESDLLHVHNYREPAIVREAQETNRLAHVRATQEAQAALRQTAPFKGTKPRQIGTTNGEMESLFESGRQLLERLPKLTRKSAPIKLADGRWLSSHPLTKEIFASLKEGDVVWDTVTLTPYRVGIDLIPRDIIMSSQGGRHGWQRLGVLTSR
jgi:hypothetical protein